MAQLALHFLGQPVLEHASQPYEFRLRKGVALLAVLAVEESPQTRERLATLLWPEYDQAQALANLRRTLYRLNQTPFAAWLRANDFHVSLPPHADHSIDVARFRSLLNEGTISSLEAAVALYRNDFLSDFYLPTSDLFEQWASVERESFRRHVLEAWHKLAEHYLASGAFRQAEAAARSQLRFDELRESAWRELMQALVAAGRRAEALAAYQECCQVLHDELGVEPSTATRALRTDILSAGAEEEADELRDQRLPRQPRPRLHPVSRSPYRGLQPFTEKDASYFFGREVFTELLIDAVHRQSIVALVGPSGSGKSSVVQAGMLSQLRSAQSWQIASFRPDSHPFHSLAEALLPYMGNYLGGTSRLAKVRKLATTLADGQVTLSDAVALARSARDGEEAAGSNSHFLLIADQFEELYTLSLQNERRRRFLDLLLEPVFQELYRPSPNFTLMLVARADFLAQLLSYRPLADAIQESDVKLGPMSRAEMGRAIANPAALVGVSFEPGLVERLLDDVGEGPGRLPLLQFTLALLWERRLDGQLLHSAYEATGKVEGALARYAERVYGSLTGEEQKGAQRIFVQLVQPGSNTDDTRRVASRDELGQELWDLVQRLAAARLVVTGRDAVGEEKVEVVHEALLKHWARLQEWMVVDREFRLWQERLRVAIEIWEASERDESAMLRGVTLSAAEAWLAQRGEDLSEIEQQFIRASSAVEQARFYEAQQARLAAEAENLLHKGASGELPALLALHSLQFGYSPTAQAVLYRALDHGFARHVLLGHRPSVRRVCYSPDGQRLLSSGDDGSIRPWDVASGRERRQLVGHRGRVFGTFSPDGGLVASAGHDRTVRLWNVRSGRELWRQEGHSDLVNSVQFSPDGQRLLSTSDDHTARLWEVASGALLAEFVGHDDWVLGSAFSSNGHTILTGSRDMTVREWDVSSGKVGRILEHPTEGTIQVQELSYSADDAFFLTVAGDDKVYVWDRERGEIVRHFVPAEGARATCATFSPDARLLLAGSEDGRAIVWEIPSGRCLRSFTAQGGNVLSVAFRPNGRQFATGSEDGSVRLWDLQLEQEPRRFAANEGRLYHIAFSPDGSNLFTSDESEVVRLWDVESALPGTGFDGHYLGVSALAVAPNGTAIFTAAWNKTVRLWDIRKGRERWRSTAGGEISRALFSTDGAQIVSGDLAGALELRDAATGRVNRRFLGHEGEIWSLCLSSREQHLLSGSWDGTARLWNILSGEPVACYTHESAVVAAVFLSDGERLLTVSDDHRAWIWRLESDEPERFFQVRSGPLSSSALSPSGKELLVSGADGIARLYDLRTEEEIGRFTGHDNRIVDVAFAADGKTFATASWDGTARLWRTEMADLITFTCSRLSRQMNDAERAQYGVADDCQICLEK